MKTGKLWAAFRHHSDRTETLGDQFHWGSPSWQRRWQAANAFSKRTIPFTISPRGYRPINDTCSGKQKSQGILHARNTIYLLYASGNAPRSICQSKGHYSPPADII